MFPIIPLQLKGKKNLRWILLTCYQQNNSVGDISSVLHFVYTKSVIHVSFCILSLIEPGKW